MRAPFPTSIAAVCAAVLIIAACNDAGSAAPHGTDASFAFTESTIPDGGYTVTTYTTRDALYQFVKEDDSMRLRSDPDITSWGDDFWGEWEDPFTLDGNTVSYSSGLASVTYDFTPLTDGTVDIVKTLVTCPSPYGPCTPTTTVTDVGNAELTNDVPEACPDADGDGEDDVECGGEDCDDSDFTIFTWASEICRDGIDQDCDGADARCDCYTTKGRFRYCK